MKRGLHTIYHRPQFLWMDVAIHTICHRPQFSWMGVATENIAKNVLRICQKTAYSAERISRNAHESNESLSTHSSDFEHCITGSLYNILFRCPMWKLMKLQHTFFDHGEFMNC